MLSKEIGTLPYPAMAEVTDRFPKQVRCVMSCFVERLRLVSCVQSLVKYQSIGNPPTVVPFARPSWTASARRPAIQIARGGVRARSPPAL